MNQIEKLKQELKDLRDKRDEAEEIKKLKRQIKAEKFSETKTGKVINTIGKFGERITRPKPKGSGTKKPKKKSKVMSIDEIMKKLPQ